MWMLLSLAHAADDAAIVTAVSALYDRTIPQDGVCIERPTLPAQWTDAAAVGTRQGARGCALVGVMVGDELASLDRAASLSPSLSTLSDQDRGEALAAWTREVVLAFDTLDGDASIQQDRSGTSIRQTAWAHTDVDHEIVHRTALYRYDTAGMLAEPTVEASTRWKLEFFGHKDVLQGVNETTAKAGIDTKGSSIAKCFWKAASADPSLQGAVKLRFSVKEGKAGTVTYIAQDRDPQLGSLAQCYAKHVEQTTWPAEAAGSVTWVFAATRHPRP